MSSGGLFSGKDKQQEVRQKIDTHSSVILNVVERQKGLESSLDNLKEKVELIDSNAISNFKKQHNDIKSLRSDINDLKRQLESLTEHQKKITKQLEMVANKDEVQKLERYIDLWNPMDFVTREEMEEFREKIKKDLQEVVEGFMKD